MIGIGSDNQERHLQLARQSHSAQRSQSKLIRGLQRSAKGMMLLSLVTLAYGPPSLAQSNPAAALPALRGAPVQPEQLGESYILGAGDRIRMDIFNVPEYSGENQVLSDGSLNLPLIGRVMVQGMTLKQTSDELSARYAAYLKRPSITLSLIAARPVKIAIAGEVNRPGSYSVALAADTGIPTLTRALQLAGGITQSADIGSVQLRRPRPRNSGPDQIITVNLWDLLRSGDLRQDLLLRDGDSIVVPTATNIDLNEAPQLAAASFAGNENRPLKIAVVGEVNRPGPYTLTGEVLPTGPEGQPQGQAGADITPTVKKPTLTRAIQIAGGITQSADIRSIQVRRTTKMGEQVIAVNLWDLLRAGELNQDLPLQEGDTILIPTAAALDPKEATELASASFSPSQITVNVVGEVAQQGAVQVPPNTPLNQALLAAGGFNNRARKGSVELIRLNPNGTVARRTVNVDFSKGIDEANNPALRNNDTVVVGKSGIAGVSDTLGLVLSPVTGALGLLRFLFGGF